MSAYNDQVTATQQRLAGILSNAFTTLNLSLGVKLGLFEKLAALASAEKPVTSQELADACNLRERYIREWLNGLVVAEIVQVDAEGKHYWLSDTMKEALKTFEMLSLATFIPMIAPLHDRIASCFDLNGPRGTCYSEYKSFHKTLARCSAGARGEDRMMKVLLPSVEGLFDQLQRGCTVLDIGCGEGWHTSYMAKAFPKSTFYALDFCEEPIKFARENFAHLANAHYLVHDARKLPDEWTGKFDFILLVDTLHDQARPDLCLKEMNRVIHDGGVALIMDIKQETNVAQNIGSCMSPIFYTLSLMHCMPISLREPDGMGLGTCWGRELACKMFAEAGFKDVKVSEDDSFNFIYILRKREPTN